MIDEIKWEQLVKEAIELLIKFHGLEGGLEYLENFTSAESPIRQARAIELYKQRVQLG